MILRFLGRLVDVAAELARTAVAIGEVAGEAVADRLRERQRYEPAPAPPPPQPTRAAAAPPPPAPAAPAPAPRAPEPEPLVAAVPEPTRGQAARIRERRREAEQTEDSPGAEVRVAEPWPGYAKMNAPEIIDRVRVSDAAVRAIVLLYERSHRKRKTVLRAADAS